MGSSENEIKAMAKDLGLNSVFLGTFDKHFPGFINKNAQCCAIVNTGDRQSGGVHWLAFGWEPKGQTFFMFDPFGFSDAKLKQMYDFEYEGLMKRSAIFSTADRCIQLKRNDMAVQGPKSAACGLFCLMFLYAFLHWPWDPFDNNPIFGPLTGIEPRNLFLPKSQAALFKNQEFLYTFLRARSVYFRDHETQIKSNTAFDKLKQ